jgi:hypothetical protein
MTARDQDLTVAETFIRDHFFLPTGHPYGQDWQPFQQDFFHAVFATKPDGLPLHRLVYDERRRGESKTADTAAAAIAALLTLPHGSLIYVCAGDADQAALIVDHANALLIRSHPKIREDLIVGRWNIRHKIRGTEVRVISADAPTAYGISPRLVIYDELSLATDDRLWTAMFSAIGKSPYAQMVAVSMAGWDFASIGWKVRELAASNPKHYFHTREGSELAPWLSAENMEEQRETLHPSDFARFWECRWTEPKGSWITKEMYDAAEVGQESQKSLSGFKYVGFVDVGLVHDPTAIAVAHAEDDRTILDTMFTLQGTRAEPVDMEAVEDLVVDLTERFKVQTWVFEAPQAVASVQRLVKRLSGRAKVTFRFPTANTQAELFGNLYRLFSTAKLVLFEHEQLRREALALVIKTVSGRLKVVESSAVHQDHVIALGGAAGLLVAKRERDDNWGAGMTAVNNRLKMSGPPRASWALTSDRGDPYPVNRTEADNDAATKRALERAEENMKLPGSA